MNALAIQMPNVRRALEPDPDINALAVLAAMGRQGGMNALAMPNAMRAMPQGEIRGGSDPNFTFDTPAAGGMADQIRAGLVRRGMPAHVADAFILNFQDESALNPGINEAAPIVPGSRGGFGLAQWTGPRRRQLESYAAQRGSPADDLDVQLDFLMTELQGPESRAAERIMAAGNTGDAAVAIVEDFLRPLEQHQRSRAQRYTRYR